MMGTAFSSLTAAIDQASDCIVITDAGGTIQYVNSAFTAITGYCKEEAVGRKPSLLKSGCHSAAFYEELWRTISTGQVWHGVVTNRRKDRTLYDEEMRITPVRGPDGNISGYFAIKYDVTEKRALEESRNLLATIVEASKDAILSYSPEGLILTWNRGAESIFGYSAGEVIGKPLAMLVAPERLPFLPQFSERLLQGDTISQLETLCVRKDRETIHASVTGCSIRNSAGKVTANSVIVRDFSERYKASRRLQESEQRFREVFENASIGIFVVGPDGQFIQANATFCKMVGYSEEELLEMSWLELCHPDDRAFAMQTRRQFWKSPDGKVEVEGRFIQPDGNAVWSRMNISLIRGDDGIPLYSVIHAEDITERKRAEDARRESEVRFRNMADSSPSMMWVTDAEGRVEFMNRALRKFYGIEGEEANGIQWHMPIHPDDLPKSTAMFVEAMSERKPIKGESRVRRADGEWRLFGTNAEPRLSPDGKYLGHIGLCADITERRQAEQKLRESEERFRAVFEHAPSGICMIGLDGRYKQVNEAFCRMLGYSEEEVMAKLWSELTHPDDLGVTIQTRDRDSSGASGWGETEKRYIHRSGVIVWAHIRIALIRNADDTPLWYVIHVEDITERKRAEQALIESEHRFRIMADSCPIGIWVTDAQGNNRFVNRNYLEFCGLTADQIQQSQWQALIHPEDAQPFFEAFQRALKEHTTLKVERRSRRADGEWRWMESYAEPRFSPDGEFLGLAGISKDITERKQNEQSLQFHHSIIRAIHDVSLDGILVVNKAECIVSHNQRFKEVWQLPQLEISDNMPDYFVGDRSPIVLSSVLERVKDPDAFLMRIQKLNDDPNANDHCEIELKDGRTVERYTTGIRSENGEHLGRVWFFRDITGRKQAEQALRNSEEKFRQLAENIREVFFIMSPSGTELLYVSPAVEEVWGVPLESLYRNPMSWADAIHPDDRAQAHLLAARQLQGERVGSEFRIQTPDGKEKWIHSRTSPIFDQAGELIRVVGIAEEITERRQAEISLKRIADRLTLATRAGGVGTWSNDLVHKVVEWDEQMFRLYGISPDRFADAYEAWQAGMHPDDRQRVNEENEAAIRGEREFDSEFRVVWPDGSIHHIRALALVKRDDSGKATGLVGTNWDITAQKHAAEALLESNRQLEKETSRANQLAIEAEQANVAKSEFLANMSHEIRTPMNGIMGLTSLLLETELDETQRSYADTVLECSDGLLTLINAILDISKIEAGKVELEALEFDLETTLEDLVSVLAVKAYGKGLELLFELEPTVPTLLRGDVGRLRQIVNNLVGNAMKFTSAGDVELNVTLSEETADEVLLHFSVRDSGIGIPADRIGRLFNKFSQVDSSTTRLYGGTGLGLAISRQLAEMMGGAIGVTSKEGEGSEFWFTARFGKQARARVERIPPSGLEGQRALIVKDRLSGFRLLDRQLRSAGLRTSRAENDQQTLQALYGAVADQDPFHIVIVDLPVRGESLARTIKSDATLGEVRVVLLEPIGSPSTIRSPELDKIATYVTRPVRSRELFDALCPPSGKTYSGLQSCVGVHAKGATPKPFVRMQGRILLAEDNVTNQKVAVGILHKLGLSVDVTCNGVETLKALEAKSYDLILMDVQMPVMDGIEATKRIRASKPGTFNSGIPIIALTAHARQSDHLVCIAAGMNDYLSKPVSVAALTETILRWLPADARDIRNSAQKETSPATSELQVPPVFDRDGMSRRLMGDEELMIEVIAEFLVDTPRQIAALRMLIDLKDAKGAGLKAHLMKGAASNVGGEAMRAVAYELEQAGKGGDLEVLAAGVEDLDREFLRLRDALTTPGDRRNRSTAREEVHHEDTSG
jgi:PAS domain S-box-containing protein